MKIAIITQARMTSTRLPGKVLKIVKGEPLLFYHVERARLSGISVIVATTINKEDDVIAQECQKLKVPCFRGDESDVLGRYYNCAKELALDTIVRITSDCPLIDGALIKKGVESFAKSKADYLSNTVERTFPRGFDFEIFSFKALQTAYQEAKDNSEREHVTPYIWRNNPALFKIESYVNQVDKSDYRITVDTELDFLLIKELIEEFRADQKNCQQIIEIFEKYPELAKINENVKQKEYGQ